MKSAGIVSVVFSAIIVCGTLACTKTITEIVPPGDDAGTSGGVDTIPNGGNTSGGPTSPILTPGDDDDTTTDGGKKDASVPPVKCDTTTNQSDCLDCCAQQHPTGSKTYRGALTTCVCSADVCQFECSGSLCATPAQQPTDDCAECANDRDQGSCGAQVTQACNADTDCVAFNNCLTSSSCSSKPAQ